MARKDTPDTPQVDLAEINAVYESMNIATATSRAYFNGLGARPQPTMLLTVSTGSNSLPPA